MGTSEGFWEPLGASEGIWEFWELLGASWSLGIGSERCQLPNRRIARVRRWLSKLYGHPIRLSFGQGLGGEYDYCGPQLCSRSTSRGIATLKM